MKYKDLPLIPIDIIRGDYQSVRFQNWTGDGTPLDLTTIPMYIDFKDKVDPNRYVTFSLTEENGGLEIEPNYIELIFGEITRFLPLDKYYGDLFSCLTNKPLHLMRFELNLSGIVTSKDRDFNPCTP